MKLGVFTTSLSQSNDGNMIWFKVQEAYCCGCGIGKQVPGFKRNVQTIQATTLKNKVM
jgi:hypothetical protein